MTFSDELYEKYRSTHVAPRDGESAARRHQTDAVLWESVYGEHLPPMREAAIIDLGCGSGSLLHWLQSRGYPNAEGIDLSPEEVAAAHQSGVRNVRAGRLEEVLSTHHGHFDLIILRDVLEHLPKQVAFDTLKGILGSLKPGGRLWLQVPNGASPFVGRTFYGDFTHEWAYTNLSLSQLAHAIGYRIIAVKPYHPCSGSLKSRFRNVLLRIGESLMGRYLRLEMGDRSPVMSQVLVAVLEKKGTD